MRCYLRLDAAFFAVFLADFFPGALGISAPERRASLKPIAIACFRFFTVCPLRPDSSLWSLNSSIVFCILLFTIRLDLGSEPEEDFLFVAILLSMLWRTNSGVSFRVTSGPPYGCYPDFERSLIVPHFVRIPKLLCNLVFGRVARRHCCRIRLCETASRTARATQSKADRRSAADTADTAKRFTIDRFFDGRHRIVRRRSNRRGSPDSPRRLQSEFDAPRHTGTRDRQRGGHLPETRCIQSAGSESSQTNWERSGKWQGAWRDSAPSWMVCFQHQLTTARETGCLRRQPC
jgi:hypothetical protein